MRIMKMDRFASAITPREPNEIEFTPTVGGYSAYGPQRVLGRIVRRDPRQLAAHLGASADTPNPDLPTATLQKEWLGGNVTIQKGEWGYIGPIADSEEFRRLSDTVNLKIIAVAGPDGAATFYFKTEQTPNGDIPTSEYAGGTNNWPVHDIVGQGEWHRPGIVSSIARIFTVNPLIMVGLVAGALLLRHFWRRKNPWYQVHRSAPGDLGPEPMFLESSLRAARSRAGKYNFGERKKGSGASWGWKRLNPARSERQRRLFGAALGYKRGTSRRVTAKARALAKRLPERTLREFARKKKR